jgi:hypothetical protein
MRASGEVTPRPRGGDRRSGRIEAEAEFILQEIADRRDITLEELQAKLQERGTRVGIGTLWRIFDRRRISFKKSGTCCRATAQRCRRRPARLGQSAAVARSCEADLSERNRHQYKNDTAPWPRPQRRALCRSPSAGSLDDDNPYSRSCQGKIVAPMLHILRISIQ